MPSMTCRDTDEVCDWFFRDPDYLRLIATGAEHTISAHPTTMKPLILPVYAGETKWSENIPAVFRSVRWD